MEQRRRSRCVAGICVTLAALVGACSDSPSTPSTPVPPQLPVTPPDTTPAPPTTLSSVADVLAGNTQREVLLAGTLVRADDASTHRYRFTDNGNNELTLDFGSDHLPPIGRLVLVWGKVQSTYDVDVIAWSPITIMPDPPVTPPTTPPDSTTVPPLVATKIGDIVAGRVSGEVIIAGTVLRQKGSDDDEWFVGDDTGEIVVDFKSDHRPGVGTAIFVWGSAGQFEIDEIAWCRQDSC